MVQRTKLALILLLAWLAVGLAAQNAGSYTPPQLLTDTALSIPGNWKQTYNPMEVLILVNVKTDSTATLARILDGKNELQSLIEALMPDLLFLPALSDGKQVESQISLHLPIIYGSMPKSQVSGINDSLRIIDKTALYAWINHARETENRQNIFSTDSLDCRGYLPQVYETFYCTNNFMLGLNSDPYLVLKDGFLQTPHLYYNALQYQMLSNFRQANYTGGLVEFANPRYNLPALCTDVYAGLGDYEFNFARVQILKNHLLGIKDFYTEIGLLVQNGFWEETISNQTSTRVFLSLPVKGTTLSIDFEKYDQNIPSTSLLTGIQGDVAYRIAQVLQNTYLKWQLPWFTLGWQRETERLNARGRLNPQEYNVDQLMLNTKLNSSMADLRLQYQYYYRRTLPDIPQLYQFDKRPVHQGLASLSKQVSGLDYQIMAVASPQSLDLGRAKFGYKTVLGRLGLDYQYYNGSNRTVLGDSLFPDNVDPYQVKAVYTSEKKSVHYTIHALKNLVWDISLGQKTIDEYKNLFVLARDSIVASTIFTRNKPWFGEAYLQIKMNVWRNEMQLDQTLQWTQFKPGLLEQPELQGQTRLKISRDMGYHNALSAGLNLTGHTDYRTAGLPVAMRYGALVADAWIGVKITDLFEFQVSWKNLNNNILYGVLPAPRTLMASIHWFYLN